MKLNVQLKSINYFPNGMCLRSIIVFIVYNFSYIDLQC